MKELSQALFDIYCLARPRGQDFGEASPVAAWQSDDAMSFGVALSAPSIGERFDIRSYRRRIDHVWAETASEQGFAHLSAARARIGDLLLEGAPPEALPRNMAARPALHDLKGRTAGSLLRILTAPSHHPAGWMLNQLYLSLPAPDANWAADCQTKNFHTRLWEAQLLATFREQGLLVTQPHPSPDFRIENADGAAAWVEAVTANPPVAYDHVNAPIAFPDAQSDLFFGTAAVRFAKTLGNKLERRYDQLPHVIGDPFMIAIADFHAPASMIWSREGLIGYLYGLSAEKAQVDGRPQAVARSSRRLRGPSAFPAGLFTDDRCSELAAVIFSNACSIAKLNRVAVSGLGAPSGLRYTRVGMFFDRSPGALVGIPFCHDVTSAEYRGLWPHGYEPWSAELEVFHNPFARHRVPIELIPEATHWLDQDGELTCSSVHETSILWSQTMITEESARPPGLADFLPNGVANI